MKKSEWIEKLKDGIVVLQEPMVYQFLKLDMKYEENSKRADEYEEMYNDLRKKLNEEDRQIIDGLMDYRDKSDMDYSVWSFIAGLQTGLRLKELFDIENEKNK